jgi:hypothetical protein
MMTKPFPPINRALAGQDKNPAIMLFGRRFFSDQTALEFLAEMLLVLHAPKLIGDETIGDDLLLPRREQLVNWPTGKALSYRPRMRLNLKLFAFLGSSKLDTRHSSHRQHYKELLQRMKDQMVTGNAVSKDDVLRGLENLFQGFQGAGLSRTWCAQTFMPISPGVLAGEAIWNETQANAVEDLSWDQVTDSLTTYFSLSGHNFYARGGEVLYLQLCNALRQPEANVLTWIENNQLNLSDQERSPGKLYDLLIRALPRITNQCPPGIQTLASWVDQIDPETTAKTDERKPAECGWCPEESWPEAYLFAVELSRICRANLDPIERVELLVVCCALQVLRSLCAQSARYDSTLDENRKAAGGSLGFAWIIAGPSQGDRDAWKLSERNLMAVQNMIYTALRHEDIRKLNDDDDYADADRRYGHKLFLSLAKKIGLIVPQRGPGAHFTLNDKTLRYLVFCLIRPGHKCTLDSFKVALYSHYGIAITGEQLSKACGWSGVPALESSLSRTASWFEEMLSAAGFLVRLSDACSLVQNPFEEETALVEKLATPH